MISRQVRVACAPEDEGRHVERCELARDLVHHAAQVARRAI